jgi:hypothetical protein
VSGSGGDAGGPEGSAFTDGGREDAHEGDAGEGLHDGESCDRILGGLDAPPPDDVSTPAEEPVPPSLDGLVFPWSRSVVRNGEFSDGSTSWNLTSAQGVQATMQVACSALCVVARSTTDLADHDPFLAALTQSGLTLSADTTYNLSYSVVATSPVFIGVAVYASSADGALLDGGFSYANQDAGVGGDDAGTDLSTFVHRFRTPADTETPFTLAFVMALTNISEATERQRICFETVSLAPTL